MSVASTFKKIRRGAQTAVFLLFLYIFAIGIPWSVGWLHFRGLDSGDWISLRTLIGAIVAGLATVLVIFNLNTSFIWPWQHKRVHGNLDDYKYVSGAPIIGNLLILIAAVLLPKDIVVGLCLLLIFLLDTCGFHVAALVMTREFVIPGKTSA